MENMNKKIAAGRKSGKFRNKLFIMYFINKSDQITIKYTYG